jgi:threonine/homoserine/homoserine lactone efflux protein
LRYWLFTVVGWEPTIPAHVRATTTSTYGSWPGDWWVAVTLELLLAFVAFAFVAAVTPGPNNVMLLASGVNFGFLRSVPHMLGIAFGFAVMVAAVGMGLGGLFRAYPVLYEILRWIGAAYLLYLAWGIARSGVPKNGDVDRPLSFLGAAAFQWVNPKAWVMALGAVTAYVPREEYFQNVLVVAAVFGLIVVPSVGVWAAFGTGLGRFLSNPGRLRGFNVAMALLLVLSLYPILTENLGGR